MAVWKLKSCPRCSGDLFIQRETDGWYEECLLCGYQRDVSDVVATTALNQIKVQGQLKSQQKIYTDIRVSDAN
jgi:hypothetical protein